MLPPAILQASSSTTVGATTQLIPVLGVALALALPISFFLIWLYRRAVTKSMRRPTSSTDADDSLFTSHSLQYAPSSPQFVAVNVASPVPIKGGAAALHANVVRAPWRAAAVYMVAGACYALILAVAGHWAYGREIHPFTLVPLSCVCFWPVVLAVNLVTATTWLKKAASVAIYFVILIAIHSIIEVIADESYRVTIPGWFVINLLMTFLLLTFLNRRVRAVGPLVLILMIIEMLGLRVMISIAQRYDAAGNLSDANFIGSLVLGLLIPMPLGWLILQLIKRRYERKRISDQSITIDAIVLLFGFGYSLILAARGTLWIFSGLLAFLAFKSVAWRGLEIAATTTRTQKAPRLLLLRAFSLGRRSAKLFAALATHWRHVGSIDLMAGPDLATSTVEPHEFLDFLSGKLARRFIDGPEALDRRCSEIDGRPDRDGRFRVNNFFCHIDTWKMVLSRLVKDVDVVVMDVRGFTSQNVGCIHEIAELINTAPLDRVVFIIETKRDEELVLETIRESWHGIEPTSPNFRSAYSRLQFFQLRSRGFRLRQLLCALCVAAYPRSEEFVS